MKSRERYLNLFNGKTVDRMPISLFITEQGHFMTGINPDTDPHDHEKQFIEEVAFQKEMGADVFVRMLADLYETCLHVIYGGVDTKQQTDNWQVETSVRKNSTSTIYSSTITTPKGVLHKSLQSMNHGKALLCLPVPKSRCTVKKIWIWLLPLNRLCR
jgi:hypothetical protein